MHIPVGVEQTNRQQRENNDSFRSRRSGRSHTVENIATQASPLIQTQNNRPPSISRATRRRMKQSNIASSNPTTSGDADDIINRLGFKYN